MNRAKVLIIGAGLLVSAGTAFADGEGEGSGSAAAGEGAGAGSATAGTPADAGAPMTTTGELISAPLTTPKGQIGVIAGIDIASLSFTIPAIPPATMPTTVSSTAEIFDIGAGYGVNEKLEVGGLYQMVLHSDAGTFPDSGEGPLTLFGAYSIMEGKLAVAAGADFQIDLSNTDNKAIHAGLAVRYMLQPKLAVFSGGGGLGLPFTAQTGTPVAPGPAGQHLSIGLGDNGPITFQVPVGVAYQATPQAYAWVGTDIANISISNSSNAFIFSDFIPVDVGVLFRATPELDVGAHFSDDLKNAGDFYTFGLMARYYKH